MVRISSLVFLIFILGACATKKPYYSDKSDYQPVKKSDIDYTVLFFGGANQTADNSTPEFSALKNQMQQVDEGSLILLGNNGAKYGLPDSSSNAKRVKAEAILSKKLTTIKQFAGDVYVLPGNHDWAQGGKNGSKRVQALGNYVDNFFGGEKSIVVPSGGCPGPYEVHPTDDIVILFLNTQWWLHEWDKPGGAEGCDMEDDLDFIVQLDDAIKRNIHKKVIVAGHHSLYSNGPHGGYSPLGTHLLPPGLGSVYAWYRRHVGGLQDLADIKYKVMIRGLTDIFKQHPNLVYLSGHEKSQQYHKVNNQHYVVSGAIADATATIDGNGAKFAHGTSGFGKLNFHKNGNVVLEFWGAESGKEKLLFSEQLFNHVYNPADENLEEKYKDLDYAGKMTNAIATNKLDRDKKNPGLAGHNYRKEWSTELKNIRYFDIGKEHGGLKIVQRGGGLQTKSLRLEDQNRKQYVLRSIEKFPEKAVPSALRGTIVSNIVADQVSASHPYGAFVVPPMAEAAGVYHTNPEIVYVPNDPRLGKYLDDFGDGIYLYEERPAKDRSEMSSFGNSKKIINTLDVVKKTQKDNKHYVDQEHVLRSRLFDMLIGDWDRHDDQWRWASFKDDNDYTYYQPIPRDRDQAFFWSDGGIMKIGSHKWGQPKFQGFHDEIRDISGLQFNARYFDRDFLNEPSLEEWVNMAEDIKVKVTDEVIEKAIKTFPPEIYALNGETIISKLKNRRKDLAKYAKQHYLFLAKEVDVVGSDKGDFFEVKRLNNEETEVKVYHLSKKKREKRQVTYHRIFKTSETKEIRLYGLGSSDVFEITGKVKKGIKIRIIGGKGKDKITDESEVSGAGKKTILYDKEKGTTFTSAGELKDKTSDKKEGINEYNRFAFQYNKVIPQITGSFNPDDGIFIGGGFTAINNKFRKNPFGSKHTVSFAIAPKSASFNFKYKAEYTDAIGNLDFLYEFDVFEPSFADFFYGFGNRSTLDEDAREEDTQFYRARYGQLFFKPALRSISKNSRHEFVFGGYYRSILIDEDDNEAEDQRFLTAYIDAIGRGDGTDEALLDERRNYAGLTLDYKFDTRDARFLPTKGVVWNAGARLVNQFGGENNSYQNLRTDFSTYFSFGGSLKTTLALRVGGEANFGDFEFYQAPRLGGLKTLRGYRRTRFAGDESFYQNTDVRIRLVEYRTPLFPGSLGITLIHDIGRVWTDQEDVFLRDSEKEEWHRGNRRRYLDCAIRSGSHLCRLHSI